jgi:hypothetical protein
VAVVVQLTMETALLHHLVVSVAVAAQLKHTEAQDIQAHPMATE